MNKLVIALLVTTAFTAPATGQSFDHPDGDQGAVWDTGNISTLPTGSAPADIIEPAEATEGALYDEEDWIIVTDGTVDYIQGTDRERKIRITCEPSTAERMDFILGFGVEPFGHMHQATGKAEWDSTATYTSNRASPSSTCPGGPLNATLYIEPALQETLANGAIAGRIPQTQTFYYITGDQGHTSDATWVRRDTAMIIGANPGNYNDTARRAVYSAAGFEYPGSPETPAGFGGWQCARGDGTFMTVTVSGSRMLGKSGTPNSSMARHLKAPDGSDPWGGACTGSVEAPGELILNLSAPECWDRHNLRAPDGRGHMWYMTRTGDNAVTRACPKTSDGDNYGHIPALQVKTHWRHAGFADYGGLFFASDRMRMPTSGCPDETEPCDGTGLNTVASLDPCREIGLDFCNGSTGHADWGYGWNSDIFDEAQRECLGISVRGVTPTDGPGECDTSQISKYRKLQYGGASPDPDMSGGCDPMLSCSNAVPGNIERYSELEAGTPVPGPVEHVLH